MGSATKIKISKDEIAASMTKNYNDFKSVFFGELAKAAKNRHRLLLILAGDNHRRMAILCADILITFVRFWKKMFKDREGPNMLYVYHDEFDDALLRERITKRLVKRYIKRRKIGAKLEIAVYEASERYLGTTYQALVMDLINSLKPNDIGRLIGIVEGGGIVILLVPNWHDWHNRKNLFQMSLAVPQHPEPRKVFVRWFKEITLDCEGVFIYDVDNDQAIKLGSVKAVKHMKTGIELPNEMTFPVELYKLALTQDQVNALKLMENLLRKPQKKRMSVILIADRGRGKSCAIGIALAGIIMELSKSKPKVRIAVTAPSLTNVQPLMNMAIRALDVLGIKYNVIKREDKILEIRGSKFSIEYWEPAAVPHLGVDIAVVDEAAGIAVPLLHKIWRSYRRTVFATTIHGYEGAGRGFSVRFMKRIREDPNTELYIYEMEEPIRYGKDDPVERWQFRVLLLDAEPDELDEQDLAYIKEQRFEYLKLDPETLFTKENEKLLRSLFGIYVLAHYRNEPDDLGMMADAPHHSIRALRLPSGKIVAAVQLAEEGPIPFEYLDSLLRGGKIPGNIIPDRLLKHARLRDIGNGVGWRIVRIAVHPAVQGRGIGSYMLSKVEEEARERGYHWVGSGFGATEELLRFWIKNGYVPVHISPDRNPVSAEYTVLVIKPLDERWKLIVEAINREFREKVLESLHDTYRDLEVGIAQQLLNTVYRVEERECRIRPPNLTKVQLDRLLSYYEGYMTYESCTDVMHKLAKHYWLSEPECRPKLSEFEERVLILKVLQGLPWDLVANILGARKSKVMDVLREIAYKFIEFYYGLTKHEIDKVLGTLELESYLKDPRAKPFKRGEES